MWHGILNEVIKSTVEYQHWGPNAITISFGVSLALTAISGWGLWQQNNTIWRRQAAPAVSVTWLTYYGVLQLAILTYGVFVNSAALMSNGALALCYVPILIGLGRFKSFKKSEAIAGLVFLIALGAMIALPYKPLFFLAFAIGGLFSASSQPFEMWRRKSA